MMQYSFQNFKVNRAELKPVSFQVTAGSPARCRDIRTPFFVSQKSRSNTCGRFGSPSGGTLNSLTRHFCFFCNVLMWHSAVIAELRQLMIVARPQTRPPPLSLSLSALFLAAEPES